MKKLEDDKFIANQIKLNKAIKMGEKCMEQEMIKAWETKSPYHIKVLSEAIEQLGRLHGIKQDWWYCRFKSPKGENK